MSLLSTLKKELLYESEVFVDNEARLKADFEDKVQIYVLLQFQQGITNKGSLPMIRCLQELADNQEDGLIELGRLKDLFWAHTIKEDRDMVFGEEDDAEVFKKFIVKFFTSEL